MNQRGFTLIEIIITIVLMAILGFMAAQLLSTTLRGSAESAQMAKDLSEATSAMEQCIAFFNTQAMQEKDAAQRIEASKAEREKLGAEASAWTPPGGTIANVLITVKRGSVELSRVF